MKLMEERVVDFIEEVDSKKPAPGGGSVSALASTLGVSLTRMVGHLTMSKKAFTKLDDNTQMLFPLQMNVLLREKDALLQLVDEDTWAFNQMMDAYKLPKDSESQAKDRDRAIQIATIHGIEVPRAVCMHSLACLRELEFLVLYGNKSAISDIGVGVLMMCSGIEGAVLNMKINLPGLTDEQLVKNYLQDIHNFMNEMSELKTKFLLHVHTYLDRSVL